MHNHDLDLVAAYADGTATSAETARVSEWLSSCQDCATEYEYQQLALTALTVAEPAVLSDLERARLHRVVREAIAADELTVAPAAPPSQRGTGRWMKVLAGSAAAVLVVTVGYGVVFQSIGNEDAGADFAAELADTTETVPSAPADGATSAALAVEEAASDAAGVDDGMMPTLTIQALGDLSLEDLAAMAVPIEMFNATDATIAALDQAPRVAPLPADRLAYEQAVEEPLTCLEEGIRLLQGELRWMGIATLDGEVIEVFRSEDGLVAVQSGTCELVFPTE